MLGLEGVAVPLGFILTIASTILCIFYGVKNWNTGFITKKEIEIEKTWKQEEERVEDSL